MTETDTACIEKLKNDIAEVCVTVDKIYQLLVGNSDFDDTGMVKEHNEMWTVYSRWKWVLLSLGGSNLIIFVIDNWSKIASLID